MSRPKTPIDWKLVDKLLEAHCVGTEIASKFSMHPNTFYDRVQEEFNMSFTEYSQQKKDSGKSNLKFAQYKNALEGNTSMQVWLGKNWLGQKDEPTEDKKFDGKLAELLDLLMTLKSSKEFEKEKDADESTQV